MNEIVLEFSNILKNNLSKHLKALTLFGSRARGDSKEFSDYDFLIVLDQKDRNLMNRIRQAEVEILDRYSALVGSVVYNELEWEKRKEYPFGINIAREGLRII